MNRWSQECETEQCGILSVPVEKQHKVLLHDERFVIRKKQKCDVCTAAYAHISSP